jgi:peptidoglycan/xylan/chitin deacetylase (PgdA/CDA1 family)
MDAVVVLLYHSVDSNGTFHSVNPTEFRKQMEYLKKNYSIVTLKEILEFAVDGNALPKKSVAITFDDGYYDNYLNAYPYLWEHNLPAAIFLTTGHCGKKAALDGVPLRMLGWNEIKEMSRNGIVLGAHTVTHPDLRKMGPDGIKGEILGSTNEIERRVGTKVEYFAYPYGAYTDEIVKLVEDVGIRAAFGSGRTEGLITGAEGPLVLKRVPVDRSVSMLMFKARLTKAVEWTRRTQEWARKIGRLFAGNLPGETK